PISAAQSSLHGAFNDTMTAVATVLIPYQYKQQRVLFPTIIVKELSSPGIMGIDLIDLLGVNFNTTERQDRQHPALASSSFLVNANETIVTHVQIPRLS
ncbi:Hypothetical predicted protein, partial [Paramuricea clavata]